MSQRDAIVSFLPGNRMHHNRGVCALAAAAARMPHGSAQHHAATGRRRATTPRKNHDHSFPNLNARTSSTPHLIFILPRCLLQLRRDTFPQSLRLQHLDLCALRQNPKVKLPAIGDSGLDLTGAVLITQLLIHRRLANLTKSLAQDSPTLTLKWIGVPQRTLGERD